MSERRSLIAPPEIMKGSTSGRTSSHISAVVMRISQIEKVEDAVAARETTRGFFVEQRRDQTVVGVKDQLMERPFGAGAGGGGVFAQRQLEERMQLHRRAAALGVLDDHLAGANVAGAAERTGGRMGGQAVEYTQVSITQI